MKTITKTTQWTTKDLETFQSFICWKVKGRKTHSIECMDKKDKERIRERFLWNFRKRFPQRPICISTTGVHILTRTNTQNTNTNTNTHNTHTHGEMKRRCMLWCLITIWPIYIYIYLCFGCQMPLCFPQLSQTVSLAMVVLKCVSNLRKKCIL